MDGAKPVQVLFPPDEYDAVLRHADGLGLTVPEFIRRVAAGHVRRGGDARGTGAVRRGASVPPVRRRLDASSAPALQRFLDTLATGT
ncbi:hypothetical protein AB0I84_19465 [Streptomyces spectabilis]|uniref:Uncharacterized protein n=1 Tax=Streptomyces spectabilis TaxID=68270 RepID=A0A5P2X031_STRST|nr:hypothetical protein [Streptomyces spectabilis]MBB5101687.1 hypothetical protein [Streptomyces spectabilis]MCI3900869.1 hypothetical protein [Streptomyces spectabilis]QEV58383.1 hypothetical protein CP982_06425 [Streptomyces spectabilis]GGV49636.1 hypothetical protein GCM10010245_78090 [Streptomyces spectabilis]